MKKQFHFPMRAIKISGVILAALFSFQCMDKPGEFIAPVADTRVEDITLLNSTYYFREVIKNDELVENGDQTVSYLYKQSFDSKGLDSFLTVTPEPATQQVNVGVFAVSDLPPVSVSKTVNELGLLTGTISALPFTTKKITLEDVNYTNVMDYVVVNQGSITVAIQNNLPVAITIDQPIVLRNNFSGDTSTIASFDDIGRIEPHQNISRTEPIDGKFIKGIIQFDPIFLTIDGSSVPVTISSSDGILFSLSTSKILADSAYAVIPEQTITSVKDSVVTMDDSVVVRNATFRRGTMNAIIENHLDINVGVDFEIHDVLQNGAQYTYKTPLPRKQQTIQPLDFSKLQIQPIHQRQVGTEAEFSIGITTISSGGQKRTVSKNDYVKVTLEPQGQLYIASFTGRILPQTITLNSNVPTNINFRDLNKLTAEEINFKGIRLDLRLPISSGFPMDYNIKIYAKNTAEHWVDSIEMISGTNGFQRIDPTASGTPVITVSNVPNFDAFISKFFPEAPDSFYLRGTVVVSPYDVYSTDNTYSIYDTSKVYPSMDVNFPMTAGIKNGHFTETVEIESNISEDVTERTQEGSLTFNFINKLPMNLTCKTYMLGWIDSTRHLYGKLDSVIISDTIKACLVGSDGYTTTPVKSKASVTLTRSQAENLNRADSLQIDVGLSTAKNDGSPVKVRTTDYVTVYVTGTLIINAVKP
ncbi:MAG TPA: hypothetical protein PK595_03765 [Bacteroidota bacterium]|nr:hypothetical protein [Bacteroidota bacterium]